ncbi:HK97 gp10 family phage protein [Peribacillus loiseleuriae]|uniref:HK97 gp10 family phage protein n=1 Tax=Peribacillus loiseleuriae TaxID=1679170 RepID=A0A0K9GRK3_9BACI|nr:HK97 gp10 family phage protein [Peribacillus loiseleuriae]KMY49231.1 hypothetical protein AC625_06595 [Peribacillus loiseleuriae]
MAKWGSTDFRQLKALQKRMEKLQQADFEKFCEEVAKELTARLLAKVIKRTPVGQYPNSSGKKGGTLRRGWTAGASATSYVDSLNIKKTGTIYEVEIINPVHYLPYVEFGHRTKDHKGWVKGQFMLTISENELDLQAPEIVEKKLQKFLGKCFGD